MTVTPGFTDRSFSFWENLEENNRPEWFKTHKEEFSEFVEAPFARVLEEASSRLDAAGVILKGGKETMFRLNRDVRFSQDKRPYKTNLSGVLTRSGNKKDAEGLAYLQIDAFGGFVAAGFYGLDPSRLTPIRQSIVKRPQEFATLLKRLRSSGLDLDRTDSLTAMPKGFSAFADHEHSAELRLKSLIVRQDFHREDWIRGHVIDRLVSVASAADELITFGASS